MFITHRERRNRRAFGNAQLAYDMASDPLWDQPDPEPEDEPEPEEADDEDRCRVGGEESALDGGARNPSDQHQRCA